MSISNKNNQLDRQFNNQRFMLQRTKISAQLYTGLSTAIHKELHDEIHSWLQNDICEQVRGSVQIPLWEQLGAPTWTQLIRHLKGHK